METKKVQPSSVFETLEGLKEQGYNLLVDLTAVDRSAQGRVPRFEVVYRVAALDLETGLETKPRVEVRCEVGSEPVLRSARPLWPAADWLEREVWDMFGVRFADRPDIKRLLMYEEFVGHPLRKDYPINKRQPLIGPKEEPEGGVNLNRARQKVEYE
ncbi:MAG: NADH-quinone oxidoreductase subunit C [Elusimicrobia bacterium]|nr:NADH-quinone oxidoreductase subunit C [Elusimicrobiota bacterium]